MHCKLVTVFLITVGLLVQPGVQQTDSDCDRSTLYYILFNLITNLRCLLNNIIIINVVLTVFLINLNFSVATTISSIDAALGNIVIRINTLLSDFMQFRSDDLLLSSKM